MTGYTTEDDRLATVRAMRRLREEIEENPEVAREFLELMNKCRPEPDPLTPRQRYERMMERVRVRNAELYGEE